MEVSFDETVQDLTLEPLVERVMGPESPTSEPLERRLGIGRPGVAPLTRETLAADPELAAFVTPGGDGFCLVKLVVSVRHDESAPFKQIFLTVKLSAEDGGEAPLAWSMSPQVLRQTDEWPVKLNLGVDLKLGFATVGAKVEAGPKKTEVTVLEAFGEGESEPAWELSSSDSRRLSGMYRFGLVVQYKKGSRPVAHVELKANVERKRALFFPYRARFGEAPLLRVALS